jgi:hypothetical protein
MPLEPKDGKQRGVCKFKMSIFGHHSVIFLNKLWIAMCFPLKKLILWTKNKSNNSHII